MTVKAAQLSFGSKWGNKYLKCFKFLSFHELEIITISLKDKECQIFLKNVCYISDSSFYRFPL